MRDIVKKTINDWDPADLLCIHCPDDEYDNEIDDIIKALPKIKNTEELAKAIQNIFTEYFGENYYKWEYKQCFIIADKISTLIRKNY